MAKHPRKRQSAEAPLFVSEEQAVRVSAGESRRRWNSCPEMLRVARLPYHTGWARGVAMAEVIGFLMQNSQHLQPAAP